MQEQVGRRTMGLISKSGGTSGFRFRETQYYRFGLMVGIRNLLRNGFLLGIKKTAGKLLQPINSFTRFPEYHCLGNEVEHYLIHSLAGRRAKVLDVGSPKCFGLYLAYQFDIEIHLTDIDRPSVREAEVLWDAIQSRAKGHTTFSVQDARSLNYTANEFDIVYSMSVVEHIEGQAADSDSLRSMLQVLKPGGLLLVTVPVGQEYVEQERAGFQGAARETGSGNLYFFQRIYTAATAEERLVKALPATSLTRTVTIWRKKGAILSLYCRLSNGVRGLLGCLNPLLSALINRCGEGIFSVPSEYGSVHSAKDLYGDLFLAWRKDL
jgi:SAM-dependent methyltransferase